MDEDEPLGLLGRSGAGKSVLLHLLRGLGNCGYFGLIKV